MLDANDSFNSKLVGLEELVGAFSGCIRIPLELMVAVGDMSYPSVGIISATSMIIYSNYSSTANSSPLHFLE